MKPFLPITLLILCLLGTNPIAWAQPDTVALPSPMQAADVGSLMGTVLDSASRKPVEFATVALFRPGSAQPLTGVTTDGTGSFALNHLLPGRYVLRVSFVGYDNRTTDTLALTPDSYQQTLPPLLLRSTANTLAEVQVTARRDLIEDREDRLVYNAGNDPSNAGGTAIDVMKKTPLLTVDPDGTIQLKGSTSIKVLVNNKPSSIMARSINEALQMIPADAIKAVEVITAPSAKYDAEGTAGVINIITKSRLEGMTGGLNGTVGNRTDNLGGNLNMRAGKWGLTAYGGGNYTLNYNRSSSVRRALGTSDSVSELYQSSSSRNGGNALFGSFNLDYELDSTNQFGLDGSVNSSDRSGTSIRDTRYVSATPRQPFRRYSDNTSAANSVDANINYTHLFARPEQTLTFLTQVNRNANDSRYSLDQYPLPEGELVNYRERNVNLNTTTELTIQTDYDHPFKSNKQKLEVGVKSVLRHVGSDYRLDSATDSTDFRDDPRRANQFDYQQHILSGYASFRINTPRKWTYTLGSRYELTRINADFVSTKTTFADRYTNLLPNVSVSKRLSGSQRIRFNYSQRIQRPSINFLNPYINSTDPKNLFFGNPYLDPELAHSAELSYNTFTKKGLNLNAMIFARLTNNAIERVTTVDTANVSYTTYQNIARNATYGLNLFGSGRPYRNWQLNGSIGVNYNLLNSAALQVQNSNWSYRVTINTSVPLPNDISLQANASYNSARILLQGRTSGFYNYAFAARKEFKKQRVVLTLNLENAFAQYNTIVNQFRTATFITDGVNENAYRNIRLSVNWRFGQLSAKTQRPKKRITNDDAKTE
ncbi:TonB-dependent receptor domain-containing protein [Fibrella sp. WM1]|uniref:TonB-dependent receptor domain-containing protein n=1 Tax=Fibrella musci TaxID=3242485 RepID=UPI0035216017